MSQIKIKGGWKKEIYDIAKSVIIECNCCHKEIDAKIPQSFGAMRESVADNDVIHFVCKPCLMEIQKVIKQLTNKRK